MPYLGNDKYEKFCQEWVDLLLSGEDEKSARLKAYEAAGFGVRGTSSFEHNARKFANRKEIKARKQEIFREQLQYREITRAGLVLRVDRVGRANLVDFFERVEVPTVNGSGFEIRLRDITTLPRELTEAVAEIRFDDNGRPILKLHDKNQANFTLLKLFGPAEASQAATNINVLNGFSPEDQKILLGVLESLQGGAGGTDSHSASQPGQDSAASETV